MHVVILLQHFIIKGGKMPTKLTFGEFFKQKRTGLKKTLRQFCAENNLDPGNISKLERGLMAPPQGSDKLEEYAGFRGSRVDGDHGVRGHGSHELLQVPHIEELLEDE